MDEVYAGVYAWQPEAISDLLYSWHANEVYTRVIGPPFNAGPTEFQHGFGPLDVPKLPVNVALPACSVLARDQQSTINADYVAAGSDEQALFRAAEHLQFVNAPRWVTPTPSSAGASGLPGQMAYDGAYLYFCCAANSWLRLRAAWNAPSVTITYLKNLVPGDMGTLTFDTGLLAASS